MYTDSNEKQSINFEIADSIEKILGLRWVNSSDELIFNINTERIDHNIRTGVNKSTKREFLKVIMSIFYPLGFLTPFTIESKLIMQSVWSSKIDWDEKL